MALLSNPTYTVRPSSIKAQLRSNYVSYYDFTNHYMPDAHEEMANIYGSQSVTGALHAMGAEQSFSSDTHIWTEEGRLHTIYTDVARTGTTFTRAGHVFRVGEVIHLSDVNTKVIVRVTAITPDTYTAVPYKQAGFGTLGTVNITAFVIGSEFKKGTSGMQGTLETDYTVLSNDPIIQKDGFAVNGSDATNIGWIKTDQGYLWYLKSEEDSRRRWEDHLELLQILAEKAEMGSQAEGAGLKGTEGLFEAVRKRGNIFQGTATTLIDFDNILKRFDAQGKIQDYMFYVDRDQSLAVDNLLGELNAGYNGGVSYGIFENGEEMSVNLGFRGFKRGTYNFFKNDWKLLNDPTLLGAVDTAAGKVRGIMIPVGTKEVYEGQGMNGEKVTTPFLTCMYKAYGNENRYNKEWLTGSVGMDTPTSEDDIMKVNRLSERLLKTCGANNFMLFEGA